MEKIKNLNDALIPLQILQKTMEQFERLGIEITALRKKAGIKMEHIAQRRGVVPYSQLFSLYDAALSLCGNPSFGLTSGKDTNIGVYGVLGYAMMSASTLVEAIDIAIRYHKIMVGKLMEVGFLIEGKDAVIQIFDCYPQGRVRNFIIEQMFSGFLPLVKDLTGHDAFPSEVSFAFPAPDYASEYSKIFKCRVRFNTSCHMMRFKAALLETRLSKSDEPTLKACEKQCEQFLSEFDNAHFFSGQVRNLMLGNKNWDGFPSMDILAELVGCDVRTIRRRLRKEGTSYQIIKDNLRKELAVEYLQNTRFSVQEIGELLGFSEATNFRKAFIRWTGKPPSYFRGRHP